VAFGNSSIESKHFFFFLWLYLFDLQVLFIFLYDIYDSLFFFNISFIFHRSASLMGSCPKVAHA
jgi:hypothetical protein